VPRHLRYVALAVGIGVVLVAGGARIYTLRASGNGGCPAIKDLHNPVISFQQARRYYVTVTLTNPNACWGIDNEPMAITLYGPNQRRAITYTGGCCPHSDVGICCNVTLPPRGTWTVRLGNKIVHAGSENYRICNVHVEPLVHRDVSLWKRMPEGGSIVGHGSFPPRSVFDPTKTKSLPDDPTWRAPC
jgi:hypothetical protein